MIADVHGHGTALDALLGYMELTATDRVTFLGDLVDGGSDSRGVLDRVMSMGAQAQTVLGNHESMLLAAMTDDDVARHWLRYGGDRTLASFGVARAEQIPKRYRQWLLSLPLWIEEANYVFVHAGVDPKLPLADQTEQTLLWQHHNDPQPLSSGKTLVTGHRPRSQPVLLDHHLSLDTGIACGGLLTAIELPEVWGDSVRDMIQVDAMGARVSQSSRGVRRRVA